MKEENIKVLKNLVQRLIAEIEMIKRNQDTYVKIFNNIHKRIKKLEEKQNDKR